MAPNGHPTRGRDGAPFEGDGGDGSGRHLPALPVTWRPHRTRTIAHVVAGTLTVSFTAIAAALPSDGSTSWSLGARIGVACIGFGGAVVLLVLARSKAVGTRDGLKVVNMLRTRHLEWAQIVSVNLRQGDTWALLDLDDGTTLSVMGIQPADGIAEARAAVAELRTLVDHFSYN